MVRPGRDGAYHTLAQFLPARPPRDPEGVVDDEASGATPVEHPGPGEHASLGGPTSNAARQPIGALSGVTVYCTAGHGWTAGDTAWYLQRPVLRDMCEDYGNLDVLNYFAAFAYNAGATVVLDTHGLEVQPAVPSMT